MGGWRQEGTGGWGGGVYSGLLGCSCFYLAVKDSRLWRCGILKLNSALSRWRNAALLYALCWDLIRAIYSASSFWGCKRWRFINMKYDQIIKQNTLSSGQDLMKDGSSRGWKLWDLRWGRETGWSPSCSLSRLVHPLAFKTPVSYDPEDTYGRFGLPQRGVKVFPFSTWRTRTH